MTVRSTDVPPLQKGGLHILTSVRNILRRVVGKEMLFLVLGAVLSVHLGTWLAHTPLGTPFILFGMFLGVKAVLLLFTPSKRGHQGG